MAMNMLAYRPGGRTKHHAGVYSVPHETGVLKVRVVFWDGVAGSNNYVLALSVHGIVWNV